MNDIAVIIPTSPIPIHPSTEFIEQTINSCHAQLPDSPIHIMCDGVRKEMEHRRDSYQQYIYRLYHRQRGQSYHVYPFCLHYHQAGLLKKILQHLKEPYFLFCEHDCVLDEKPIDWEAIKIMLSNGEANTVRLYWHETIHPEHEYLMDGRCGDFVMTNQWSGWPFIGRREFYIQMLDRYFAGDQQKQMLESGLYGPVLAGPWNDFRTWIYCKTDRMGVTFRHLNGRVDPKTGEKDFGDW